MQINLHISIIFRTFAADFKLRRYAHTHKQMEYKYINRIDSPADLKQIPMEELPAVCAELRDFIIEALSKNPGHLASSLGAIELTVALHYVFDTPNDKLVWDVGHQAYAHKILTGRRDRFHTNRQFKGLNPFTNPMESEYDAFIAGHASNSISAALGIEVGGERLAVSGERSNVVAIIGDGAMTGGLAFEGLNNTSMDKNNLLIVLNDNHMAIDPLKGGFTQYLVDITTSEMYNKWRWRLYQLAVKLHLMNDEKRQRMLRRNNNWKAALSKQANNIFTGLNIRYFGPTDGHDVVGLVRILNEIKNHRGPKVLHIITKKGKGYAPAENDQTVWHAPGEFDVATGLRTADAVGPSQSDCKTANDVRPASLPKGTINASRFSPVGILIKNPVNADAELWLGNIERLEKTGVPVMAVHRGCNHQPHWEMAHKVRLARPDIPMLLDPSHMSGDASKVPGLMSKIEELGLDGAMVEVHNKPSEALSDAKQQISPDGLTAALKDRYTERPQELLDHYVVRPAAPVRSETELNWLRAEIDKLDERLWSTIAARMDVSKRIGVWKKAHDVAPLQPERYRAISEKLREKSEELGLRKEFIEQLWNILHEESLRQQ